MARNSWNSWLLTFELGERRYVDTTIVRYAHDMRTINTPKSRRPDMMAGLEFTTQLFTAISASNAGDVRYLIAVERVK
jgi:hypothetical protein